MKRIKPGRYVQGTRFPCLQCGLSVEKKRVFEHIRDECAPEIKRRRELEKTRAIK